MKSPSSFDLDAYLRERTDVRRADECWLWQLSVGSHGYGQGWDGRTVLLAHRLAYETWVGPIPEGMEIHHACHNRRCVNPAHLQCLTPAEHAAINANALRTHCRRGHAYTPENTRTDRHGWRTCRTCARPPFRNTERENAQQRIRRRAKSAAKRAAR